MQFSAYQEAIFNFGANGTGNAIIEAVAGSGKSTTLVELVKRLFGSHIFLAFNRSTVDELKKRGMNAKTFHGLCTRAVLNFKRTEEIEPLKLSKLVAEHFGAESKHRYQNFCKKLVGLAKQSGIGAGLMEDTLENWQQIVAYHDLEIDNDEGDIETGIELARILLKTSNESRMVDYDDVLYLVVKEGLALPRFNNVLVDESQDTNAIQRAIIHKILNFNGRLFAVGDSAQAIYGFRGADSNSMNMIAEEFKCTKLPLTVSYRCCKAVVEHAKRWVAHIEPAPTALEGAVQRIDAWDINLFETEDMIVCRTTRPLISLAYKMLKAHKPVRIMGKDIGEGLVSLIKKMKSEDDIDVLQKNLLAYQAREVEKAREKEDERKMESITDKVSAILTLAESLEEGNRTVEALIAVIRRLFDEKGTGTTLATIHKAKGLEAFAVYWLNSSMCPSPFARQPWQQEQERNLCYVATTRAKSYLGLIEEDSMRKTA